MEETQEKINKLLSKRPLTGFRYFCYSKLVYGNNPCINPLYPDTLTLFKSLKESWINMPYRNKYGSCKEYYIKEAQRYVEELEKNKEANLQPDKEINEEILNTG